MTCFCTDKHTTTLCAYFDISDYLWYPHDLCTQCATQTLFYNVFWAPGNLHDVLPIISNLARPISTFSMFLCYFLSLLADIWLLFTLMDYLCIPHTIVYLSDVFPTFLSLYLSSHLLMFWCFGYFWLLIGFTDCDVTIPSDSDPYRLLVISKPSNPPMLQLLILHLPLPFKKREILHTSFQTTS